MSKKVKGLPRDRYGFFMLVSQVKAGVFIPKYYDPELEQDITKLRDTHTMVRLADLCKGGKDAVLSWDTGIEVGKMAYGTGDISFIRTSDISNWELKGDPKQAISEEIYADNA